MTEAQLDIAKSDGVLFDTNRASLRERFLRGVSWNLIATVFNQGSTFLINLIVANTLGQRLFGEYAMVIATIQSLSLVAGLAMGYTATKYVAELRCGNPDKAGRILGLCSSVACSMGVLAATALFVFAPILSSNLNAPHLAPLLKLASGVLLFSTMNSYLTGALAGLEAYRALGRAAMITGLLYLTICSSSTWTWGITGAVAGLLGSAMLQWLILFYAVKREANLRGVEIRYRGLKDECFVFYRFSLPGALSGLTAAPALWLGQVFLVRQDGGYDELALYSAAYNLMIIVLFLPNVTNNVGMSLINNMRGQRNALQYRRVFWMNLLSTATIVVLGASMMAIGGKYALGAYGTNFYIGLPVLLLLLAASIPEALTIAMNQVLQSSERMWRALLLINLPRDLTIPVTAYLLVPSLGAVGLALACMVGRIIAFVIMGFILLQDRVHIGELEHGRRR